MLVQKMDATSDDDNDDSSNVKGFGTESECANTTRKRIKRPIKYEFLITLVMHSL